MKKIFTLIAMALMTISANAQKETDIPLDASKWAWGWNSTVDVTDGIMTISLTGDYGAGATGWNPTVDWTGYSKVCVVFESYTGGWGQIIIKFSDDTEITQTIGQMNSQTTVALDFEGNEKAKAVKQLSIQGATNNPVIKVSRVYLVEKLEYKEPVSIEIPENGIITSDKFANFSDAAKVVFTVNATGDALTGYYGWGIGKIVSVDGSKQIGGDYALKNEGDNVYTFTVKDLKPALEAPAKDGVQGIEWVLYGQGADKGNVFTRKSLQVYEVKGYDPTKIKDIKTTTKKANVRYNLAGQQVDENYKGVLIENGKKFMN